MRFGDYTWINYCPNPLESVRVFFMSYQRDSYLSEFNDDILFIDLILKAGRVRQRY